MRKPDIVDGHAMRAFKILGDSGKEREWVCKRCGLKRSNKTTHIHGVRL